MDRILIAFENILQFGGTPRSVNFWLRLFVLLSVSPLEALSAVGVVVSAGPGEGVAAGEVLLPPWPPGGGLGTRRVEDGLGAEARVIRAVFPEMRNVSVENKDISVKSIVNPQIKMLV